MKEIYKALADFQQECPIIHKGTKGYGYSYADLPTIFNTINPILKAHGLGFTQLVGHGEIKTIIFHYETGQTIEAVTEIPQNVQLKGMNDFQVLGSAITYLRRYALSSALGIVTDKDVDAYGEQTKEKPKFTPKDKNWNKAIANIKEGKGTIEAIKKHYILSEEHEAQMKEEILK